MSLQNNSTQKQQVSVDSRESAISYALFRNAVAKQLSLNTTDFDGLDLIFYRGVTTPSELASYSGLSSGSTTAMLDRLEHNGLVERRSNPNDRRGTLIVMTEQAACTIGPILTSARVAQGTLLSKYTAVELAILSDYFKASAALFETERRTVVQQSNLRAQTQTTTAR